MKYQNNFQRNCYYILFFLIFIVLLSYWALFGILARYTDNGLSEDLAHVAIFSVEAFHNDHTSLELLLTDKKQTSLSYIITMINHSEVAVSYQVILNFEESLPKGISITLDGTSANISNDNKTFTFDVIKEIKSNEKKEVSLNFSIDNLSFLKDEYNIQYQSEFNFNLDVKFVQID